MVIRHSIKELLAKSMVTRPMKCIVVPTNYIYIVVIVQTGGSRQGSGNQILFPRVFEQICHLKYSICIFDWSSISTLERLLIVSIYFVSFLKLIWQQFAALMTLKLHVLQNDVDTFLSRIPYAQRREPYSIIVIQENCISLPHQIM